MRAVWRWVLIRARFAIARRMNGGAVEATKLGGKGLTASLVRRKNDGGVETAFSRGDGAGGLFGNRRSWPGCGWFGRAAAVRSGYFAPRVLLGRERRHFGAFVLRGAR